MAWNVFHLVESLDPQISHVVTAAFASVGMVVLGLVARGSLGFSTTNGSQSENQAWLPAKSPGIKGLMEMAIEFVASISDMIIGTHGRHYVPAFATLFLFILLNNWVGLIPGFVPATENMNTTLAIGLCSFLFYNFQGFKENGIGYLKHFVGPVWWLFIIMVPIEIISNLVRPMSLGLRLANVLQGDHAVLGIFLELTIFGVPVIFYFLGMFVGFVQAFVFMMLSMVYVSLATSHDH